MTSLSNLRDAKDSEIVSYMDYLKIRGRKKGFIAVYEGTDCPTAYKPWFSKISKVDFEAQIIARNKKKLIALREKIKIMRPYENNILYFCDKDFDNNENIINQKDIYITRRYSIESEFLEWGIIKLYIESHFDIADNDDDIAIDKCEEIFNCILQKYIQHSKEINRIIYLSIKNNIRCIPGNKLTDFYTVDFDQLIFSDKFRSKETLLEKLKIPNEYLKKLDQLLIDDKEFDKLDPIIDWRGKYHLDFIKNYLIHIKNSRVTGSKPFSRKSKISIDPSHPTLISNLSSLSNPPDCLEKFFVDLNN